MKLLEGLEHVENRSFTMMPVRDIDLCCPSCGITFNRESVEQSGDHVLLRHNILPWHPDLLDSHTLYKFIETLKDALLDFVTASRFDSEFIFGTCPQCHTKHQMMDLWLTSRLSYTYVDDRNGNRGFIRPDPPVHAEDIQLYMMHDGPFFFREWTMIRYINPVMEEHQTSGPLILDHHTFGPFAIPKQGANFAGMNKLVSTAGKRWLSLVGKELKATI